MRLVKIMLTLGVFGVGSMAHAHSEILSCVGAVDGVKHQLLAKFDYERNGDITYRVKINPDFRASKQCGPRTVRSLDSKGYIYAFRCANEQLEFVYNPRVRKWNATRVFPVIGLEYKMDMECKSRVERKTIGNEAF